MGQKFANIARGTLSADITDSATTLTILLGGALFPVANGTDWFKAVLQDANGIEIVKVTGHAEGSNTFTVERGQEGTTARAFTANSVFGQRVTAADMEAAVAPVPPGGIVYSSKTAAHTAVDKEGVIADTSGGAFTVKLPAGAAEGTQVWIADGADWSANALTVDPDGDTIEGFAAGETLVCDLGGVELHFLHNGTKWKVHVQASAHSGTVLTASASQTVSNKVYANPVIDGAVTEDVFTSTSNAFSINANNGTMQQWTANAAFTVTDALASGQSVMVMLAYSGFAATWPSVVWVGGIAPTAPASGRLILQFWRVGATLYGADVGGVSV